ncbi:MAG: T9SS type A sorting domain-containing protein [Bacteroidales bacterium]|nr:T9SS type A sorting domain-containing protein [Bacteroidales bacterium]
MKNLKQLLILFLLLCCVLCVDAQTEVTVLGVDGSSTTLVVSDLGKIYFNADRMYVEAGDGTASDFLVSDIQKLTFNSLSVGIHHSENNSSVLIYPNPATNFIRIAAEDQQPMHVRLYALTGQLLSDTYCQPNGEMNISHLPSGIYFVKVNEVTYKLLKK